MTRILMVEDNEPTRRQFGDLLLAEIPDTEFVQAGSIPAAARIINESTANGTSFDAVILDCNLPSEEGILEMDTSLCPLVFKRQNEALVVHCSAYTKEEVLERHIKEEHARWPGSRACVVPKGKDWDLDLVRTLVTDRVERKLAMLSAGGGTAAAGQASRGGSTRSVAQLVADIERFWNHLPHTTRDRVRRHFDVFPSGSSVLVTPGGNHA